MKRQQILFVLFYALVFSDCSATTSTVHYPWTTNIFYRQPDLYKEDLPDPLGPGCYAELACGCTNSIMEEDFCLEDFWLLTNDGREVLRLINSKRGQTIILCDKIGRAYREEFYIKRLELLAKEFLVSEVCTLDSEKKSPDCKIQKASVPYMRIIRDDKKKDPRFCIVYDYQIKKVP